MHRARFVRLGGRRPVLVDVGAPQPRRYYLTLVNALLRCSVPAAGPFGPLRAGVARHGLGHIPPWGLLKVTRPRESPELDRLREDVSTEWQALARSSSGRLPEEAPDLALMCLRRSLGWLVFVFGEDPDPLLVCKIPDDDDPRVDAEAALLTRLSTLNVAPRYLGKVGRARVQEALPGHPLVLDPLARHSVRDAGWDRPLADAAALMKRLAIATHGDGPAPEDLTAVAEGLLTPRTVTKVRSSLHRLGAAAMSVTCHGDASAQNLMVRDGRVSGLVDWELARGGLPGADILNLAQSVFEQRLGLLRWGVDDVLEAFSAAWDSAPLFTEGRRAARTTAEVVGLDGDLAPDLETAYFARRLQRRVTRPAHYLGGPRMAAGMLERVCES